LIQIKIPPKAAGFARGNESHRAAAIPRTTRNLLDPTQYRRARYLL